MHLRNDSKSTVYMLSILKAKVNYWTLLPIFFVSFLFILLSWNSLSFDFLNFKLQHKTIHNIVTYLFVFSSGLFLLFSVHWRSQSTHKKLLLFSIIAFVASIFFKASQVFQFSIIFAISAIYFYLVEKKFYRPNLFYILLLIYFATEIISLLWSLNSKEGIKYVGNISPLAYIPLLFCLFKLNKADFEVIMITVFRISMVFVFISIVVWILQGRNLNFPLENSLTFKKYSIDSYFCYKVVFAWSNFEHPTYVALNLILSISIGWYYTFKKNIENNITYIEMAFLVVATFLLAIITASRFMLASWLVINTLGFIYAIRNKKMLLVTSIILLSIAAGAFLYRFSDKITGFFNDPARETLHNAAFQAIRENTWHGTGLGGMTEYINSEYSLFAPWKIPKAEFTHIHPHNQFIGDIMQTGVFGIITISLILIGLFYLCIKQRDWLLFMNCILFLLLMNIEMPLIYTKGIFSFALTLSLLTNYLNTKRN